MIRESGVSNVVGVILLLFLVMVTSAVLGLVLSSATYDAVDTTPDVIFTVSEDPYLLYHGGGDILYKNDLVFYAGGYDISDWIFLENEGNTWSNLWTEWHTGQAINISYDEYSASDLAIVALDSRGNSYLVYNGPTADPIPSGKPVPDVTPKPTVTPTPLPDASFTADLVYRGEIVPLEDISNPITYDADVYICTDPLSDYVLVYFTASETGSVTYAWSSAQSTYVYNSTQRGTWIYLPSPGVYTVTLTVANSYGSNTSSMKIDVEPPQFEATVSVNGYWSSTWNWWYGYGRLNVNVLNCSNDSTEMGVKLYSDSSMTNELELVLDTTRSKTSSGSTLWNSNAILEGDRYYYYISDYDYDTSHGLSDGYVVVTATYAGSSKVIFSGQVDIKSINSYVDAYVVGEKWKVSNIRYHGVQVFITALTGGNQKDMTVIITPMNGESAYYTENAIALWDDYRYQVGNPRDGVTYAEVIVYVKENGIIEEIYYDRDLLIPNA